MLKDGEPASPPQAPRRLGDLDLAAHLSDPARKQRFVTPMFDTIAPRYDQFTRVFSLGMDAGWKRAAITALAEAVRRGRGGAAERSGAPTTGSAIEALDLACGTGDLAFGVARALPTAQVVALDASERMIEGARARLARADDAADVRSRVTAIVGDMHSLALPSASFDAVTAGYGVRNAPDATTAVREMRRVLRTGGVLVTLDFYRPAFAPWRVLFLRYLLATGNAVGWWWHRDPIVYGYIAHSIEHFLSWQAFSALLEREGFRVTRVQRHLGGAIARHEAIAV